MANSALQGFEPATEVSTTSAAETMMSSRHTQEVQAAMIVSQRFPRDENTAFQRIMTSCKRRSLAEVSQYNYRRGSQLVSAASIRLAEVMAQSWGNIDYGIVELGQGDGESEMMAYCWDLQTNVRQTRIFVVKHERHTRQGKTTLTDPRDIYEMTANLGARRLRACILGVIPGDIQDAAVVACNQTLAGGNDEPLADRIRKMISTFAEISVTQEMIETRVGHNADVISEIELVDLGKVYLSIKDGMASRDSFFAIDSGSLKDLNDTLLKEKPPQAKKKKASKKKAVPQPEPEPEPQVESVTPDQELEYEAAIRELSETGDFESVMHLVSDKIPGDDRLDDEAKMRLYRLGERLVGGSGGDQEGLFDDGN